MITTSYKVEFPADVTVRESDLYDHTLDEAYPLNHTAKVYLDLLQKGLPISDIVDTVSTWFAIPRSQAESDVLSLVTQLNGAQLVNLHPGGMIDRLKRGYWVAVYLILTKELPPILVRRICIADRNLFHVAASVTAALFKHAFAAIIISAILVGILGLLTGLETIYPVAGVLVGAFAALVTHETGHAAAVHMVGRRSYLMMIGPKVAVAHNHGTSPSVHASGPVLAGLAGTALLLVGDALGNSFLVFGSLPFVAQLISITLFARDGRLLVDSLVQVNNRRNGS